MIGYSIECDTITKDIWSWALTKSIWLSAAYIQKMYSDDYSRECHSPRLDNASMVYQSTEPVDRAAACFPRDQRCSIQSSSTGSTSFAPQALPYRMQIVRRHFLNSSIPPQITDVRPGGKDKSNTVCTLTNGPIFVLKGKLIHCLPL